MGHNLSKETETSLAAWWSCAAMRDPRLGWTLDPAPGAGGDKTCHGGDILILHVGKPALHLSANTHAG